MRGWIIRIGLVAIIAAGGFVLRDRLSGDAGDLKIGDCFDEPQGVALVGDVQHHPCSESHSAEVVFLGSLPEAATYPALTVVEDWVSTNCVPAWNTYTGLDFDTDVILGLGYYRPSEDAWSHADRAMVCYAYRVDGSRMTSSVRKAQ